MKKERIIIAAIALVIFAAIGISACSMGGGASQDALWEFNFVEDETYDVVESEIAVYVKISDDTVILDDAIGCYIRKEFNDGREPEERLLRLEDDSMTTLEDYSWQSKYYFFVDKKLKHNDITFTRGTWVNAEELLNSEGVEKIGIYKNSIYE